MDDHLGGLARDWDRLVDINLREVEAAKKVYRTYPRDALRPD